METFPRPGDIRKQRDQAALAPRRSTFVDIADRKCNQCGEYGHEWQSCPEIMCKQCWQKGHVKENCKSAICRTCGEIGHTHWQCTSGQSQDGTRSRGGSASWTDGRGGSRRSESGGSGRGRGSDCQSVSGDSAVSGGRETPPLQAAAGSVVGSDDGTTNVFGQMADEGEQRWKQRE